MQNYKVTWKYIVEPDPYTGKPKVVVVFPHKVPIRVTRWNRRELLDLLLYGAFAAVFTLALLAGLQ